MSAISTPPSETTKPAGSSGSPTGQSVPSLKKDTMPVKERTGWGNLLKKQGDQWTCSDCLVQNEAGREQCVACGGAKPRAGGKPDVSVAQSQEKTAAVPSSGWGNLFNKPKGSFRQTVLVYR